MHTEISPKANHALRENAISIRLVSPHTVCTGRGRDHMGTLGLVGRKLSGTALHQTLSFITSIGEKIR